MCYVSGFLFSLFVMLGSVFAFAQTFPYEALVLDDGNNVREFGGSNYKQAPIVGSLNKNDKVRVLEIQGRWARIQGSGELRGWINSACLIRATPEFSQPSNPLSIASYDSIVPRASALSPVDANNDVSRTSDHQSKQLQFSANLCEANNKNFNFPISKYDCNGRIGKFVVEKIHSAGQVKGFNVNAMSREAVVREIDRFFSSSMYEYISQSIQCVNESLIQIKNCRNVEGKSSELVAGLFRGKRLNLVGSYFVPYMYSDGRFHQRIPNWQETHQDINLHQVEIPNPPVYEDASIPLYRYAGVYRTNKIQPIESFAIILAESTPDLPKSVWYFPVFILYTNIDCTFSKPETKKVTYQGQLFTDRIAKETSQEIVCSPSVDLNYYAKYISKKYGVDVMPPPPDKISFEAVLNQETLAEVLNNSGKILKKTFTAALSSQSRENDEISSPQSSPGSRGDSSARSDVKSNSVHLPVGVKSSTILSSQNIDSLFKGWNPETLTVYKTICNNGKIAHIVYNSKQGRWLIDTSGYGVANISAGHKTQRDAEDCFCDKKCRF